MSVVTNIMISALLDEYEDRVVADHLNSFEELLRKWTEVPLQHIAGDKRTECSVYIGAYNHLDLGLFKDHIKRIDLPLNTLESLQIFIKEQDDILWSVFKINEL